MVCKRIRLLESVRTDAGLLAIILSYACVGYITYSSSRMKDTSISIVDGTGVTFTAGASAR